ncbi:MAG: hypothetical protein P4M08_04050 [Oligoflexia bacterium]|nr:hypothetical protein [Oligoflexia bacterium]
MRSVCRDRGDCSVLKSRNHYDVTTYRVKYSDGWWFEIGTDPKVVEMQTAPSTLEELERHRDRIQTDIFGSAEKAGLQDASKIFGSGWAGGHIHVGASSALDGDARLFRNFLVDSANHAELGAGIFSNDWSNAPPIAALPEKNQANFLKIVQDFDQDKIRGIKALAQKISSEVYDTTVDKKIAPPQKYQAFNVTRIVNGEFGEKEQTIEIRAMRPQASADEFIDETRLIQMRLEFLRAHPDPIPVKLVNPRTLNNSEIVTRFYKYVVETGLPFEPYAKYLNLTQLLALQGIAQAHPESLDVTRCVLDGIRPLNGPAPVSIH